MFTFQKSNGQNFTYDGQDFTPSFPIDYMIALEGDETVGYVEIDIMEQSFASAKAKDPKIYDTLMRAALNSLYQIGIGEVSLKAASFSDFIQQYEEACKFGASDQVWIDIEKFFTKGCGHE